MKFNSAVPAALVIVMGLSLPATAEPEVVVLIPPTQVSANVPHMIGGIGLDERAEFNSRAGKFNFRLMFAEADGAFVVPDSVIVRRGTSEVLNVSDGGPLIFMNVPAGTYNVQANYKGMSRVRNIQVAGRAPIVLMTWPTERRDPSGG